MAEKKSTKIEREYTIPLRDKSRPVPRYKKTPKAVKTVKEFLARHMKIEDRDLNKIKIDTFLNEILWQRGIKKHLHKIKVRAVKENDIVKVYAVDLPKKIEFKKKRMEKAKKVAEVQKEKKKSMMDKAKETMQGKKEEKSVDENNDGVDDKVEEEEKKEAVKETQSEMAKEQAIKEKHTAKAKSPKEVKNTQKKQNKSSRGH